ncbi:MAG: hypothetical protein EOM03_16035 [Clostridia bacterium]|nr:hypothetical protein [Clostridia bacterium]
MTTIIIDWNKAGEKAEAAYDEQVQTAAGNIVVGIKELLADPNVSSRAKLTVIERLGQVVGDREQLQELLTGKTPASSKALGGPSDSSKDEENARLKGELDKARTANANLIKDREVLEEIVLDLGLTAPGSTSTPFNSDTPKRVKEKIKEMVAKAEAEAKKAAGGIDEDKVRETLEEALSAVDEQHSRRTSTTVEGTDDVKAAIVRVGKTLGIKPKPS